MRTKKILFAILTVGVLCYISSCEKDDICVDGDTPLLVIGFYDILDPDSQKDVTDLRIQAVGLDPISSDDTFTDRSDTDSIGIPLQINDPGISAFVFISNSDDDDDGNETGTIDTLTFNYTVVEEFVSRACGFVANYSELDTTRNVFSTDWIKRVEVIEPTIENSNSVHVKIFH